MPHPTRVIAAVIRRDGQLLICQRPAHKRHGGLWEFPGGKLEPNESLLEAARRELAEELALTVTDCGETLLVVQDPGSDFQIEFVEVSATGEPQQREHSDLAWVAPEGLLAYPLAPSDESFVRHLLATAEPRR